MHALKDFKYPQRVSYQKTDFAILLPQGYTLIRVQELYNTMLFRSFISFHHKVMEV